MSKKKAHLIYSKDPRIKELETYWSELNETNKLLNHEIDKNNKLKEQILKELEVQKLRINNQININQ